MWPGQQQQPGDGPNPQWSNPQNPQPPQNPPYPQNGPYPPDAQQPNPYQTPGYQAPNPYQQPAGQWGQPGLPQPPQGGKNGKGGRTAAIAIVSAVAVIAAAVVTGVFVLKDDGTEPAAKGGDPTASPSAEPSEKESEPPRERTDDPNNPRDGITPEKPDPVIPGWKVVTNAKHHNAFDVPPEWEVEPETVFVGYGEKEGDSGFPAPQVGFSAPATYKEGWCEAGGNSNYTRAIVGSKGAQGARNTAEAAQISAQDFVYFAYGEQKDTVEWEKPEKFSNEHGIEGHTATATATGVKKKTKCDADGKVVTVSWLDGGNDLRIWLIVTDAGNKDEVPQEVIDKMTSSLRPYAEED